MRRVAVVVARASWSFRLARLVVLDLDLLAEAENQDTHWWVWLDAKKRATEGHKGPVAVDETSL